MFPIFWIQSKTASIAMILKDFHKTFDNNKVLRLLGAKKGKRVSPSSRRRVDLIAEKVKTMLQPQLTYRMLGLVKSRRGKILLSDGSCFTSVKIAGALSRAGKVCCFLATVGPAVDKQIHRLMGQGRCAEAYVLDVAASMSVESVVDQFYQRMAGKQARKDGGVTLRFSPGYCDWSIRQQHQLFAIFAETDAPNVVLNSRCLMSPRKSISGLFGLLPPGVEGADSAFNPCRTCGKRDCIARRHN
jgi:hypothetical protein